MMEAKRPRNSRGVHTVSFSDVETDRVRLEIDGASIERHLWLQRVEVSSQLPPAPAG